jgi:hypothetical protein
MCACARVQCAARRSLHQPARARRKRSHATVSRLVSGHHLHDVMSETVDAVLRLEGEVGSPIKPAVATAAAAASAAAVGAAVAPAASAAAAPVSTSRPHDVIEMSAAASVPLAAANAKKLRHARRQHSLAAAAAMGARGRLLGGRAVSWKDGGVPRPTRTGAIPDVCADCSGCVLCRGPRAEKAAADARLDAGLHSMSSVTASLISTKRFATSFELDPASHEPVMYGSTIALRSSTGAWLTANGDSEAPILVGGRVPKSAALFILMSANRTAYTGPAMYADSAIWLQALDGRLLSTRLHVDGEGKCSTVLALLPDTSVAARWKLGPVSSNLDGHLSHGDKIIIEQGWFLLTTNAKHANLDMTDTRPRPCLRRAVNRYVRARVCCMCVRACAVLRISLLVDSCTRNCI